MTRRPRSRRSPPRQFTPIPPSRWTPASTISFPDVADGKGGAARQRGAGDPEVARAGIQLLERKSPRRRPQRHATVFPQAIGLGATWDPLLIHQVGEVIADEARAKYYESLKRGQGGKPNRGLNFWAPNINIFRDPRWGRGQETYGEDPYLTSRLAVGYITGLQQTKDGVLEAMACAKHFAVHSGPEPGRGGFNVNPATRDLYETYLPQFQAAVQEGHVGSVMAAYNAIYHVPCSANSWLLTDLLRSTWGFQGHVVSDCGAVTNLSGPQHFAPNGERAAAAALNAGLDLECGGTFRNLPKAVAEKLTTEKAIDTALHRVLEIRFRLGLFDPPEKDPFAQIPASEVESPLISSWPGRRRANRSCCSRTMACSHWSRRM